MPQPTRHVWYASYGSNINRDRFLCYIRGGKPEGARSRNPGCQDPTLPVADEPVSIPHTLFFSGDSHNWGGGGVAFIGHEMTPSSPTYGRMYLITPAQFLEVMSQENGGKVVTPNFEKWKHNGKTPVLSTWYGTVLYLGEKDGYPIYTFTSNRDIHEAEISAPSKAYLSTIAAGLQELYNWSDEALHLYLSRF